jgi:hypothetical protein
MVAEYNGRGARDQLGGEQHAGDGQDQPTPGRKPRRQRDQRVASSTAKPIVTTAMNRGGMRADPMMGT